MKKSLAARSRLEFDRSEAWLPMTKQFDLNLESATSRSKLAVAIFFS
jgi:hypothetical protein